MPALFHRRLNPFAAAVETEQGQLTVHVPNQIFARCLGLGSLPRWKDCGRFKAEVRWGRSRFDFMVSGSAGRCLVETKSCNLVEDGVALFPDAPTTRGVRPHREADPAFAAALWEARKDGVRMEAYGCRVTPSGISLAGEVKVDVKPPAGQSGNRSPKSS
ncbi:MAG: DNA/RNA nuclease SfsA [Thermaerobacterales bacterium]